MLFNSIEFIFVFLPVTLLGCWIFAGFVGRRLAIIWLLLCSLFFYGWFKPSYLLIFGASVLVNHFTGERILAATARSAKSWLVAGIIFNLGLLGWFKYANFVVDNLRVATGWHPGLPDILLPIGISFFTFQQIAYLMDCRAGVAHRSRLPEYALFVSYFPQLIAGPIVHPNTLLPQFERDDALRFRISRFCEGLTIFLLGLSKKVVLADALGVWASEGFAAAYAGASLTFVEAWATTLCYSLQIYFDFSGYSDMAIGLAWMVGIHLPLNFNSPYKARSIIDFWRRWHITLSTFLRDYLYIPLGGNRHGKGRRWLNLFVVMLLGGLWHGAGWTFVIWGGLHGLFLASNHAWIDLRKRVPLLNRSYGPAGSICAWLVTFVAVTVAWVFFRAADFPTAARILAGMFGKNGIALPMEFALPLAGIAPWIEAVPKLPYLAGGLRVGMIEVFGFLVIGLVIAVFGRPLHEWNVRARYLLLVPTLALTLQKVLVSTEPSEFLYFQF